MIKKNLLGVVLFLVICLSLVQARKNDYVADEIVNFYRKGTSGIYASVHYQGSEEYYQKPTSPIVQRLNTTITFDSDYELTILIDDSKEPRFKLPYQSPYPYTKSSQIFNPVYDVKVEKNPFSISVVRTTSGETIFDSSQFDFVYSDYYLGFGTKVPSKYLYGLGERRRKFLYDTGLYTIWNKDQYAQIDYGKGGQQLYGCHPMYMVRESKTGFWDVVYLRNSNAMDFKFDSKAETLEFFLTGGVIELKFFFGFTYPDYALSNYHKYINGWTLLPFWAHGYHQSKYGVIYFDDLLDVVNNFTQFRIPIDVIWSDIDYMYSFTDFTIDNERYPLQKVKELAQKVHWVPIIDAGISLNETSDAYNLGKKYDVWIKSANNNTNPLVGVVWPGVVHWVDWQNKNATKYWNELFAKFYKQAPFSGIWLDMNEYSNFCSGEFNHSCFFLDNYLPDAPYPHGNVLIPKGDQNPGLPPSPWAWFNSSALPYTPGGALEDRSLSINALHSDGSLEFNIHNLNGFLQSQATYDILKNLTGKRPFILSRSTHVGSGQFVSHWSGDNYATWDFLRLSIPCIFNFQLFGIPMSGDDICGFAGNTTAELCARWMQLGAFYPFMRNHMAIETIDHYPYSLGETVLQASKASLKLRYSMLKYYYSQFVFSKGIGTIFKPLFFNFPNDVNLLNIDTQFMIGFSLMAAAVVEEGKTQVQVYFPGGEKWFDFATGKLIFDLTKSTGKTATIDAPLNSALPVFIREGSVVPVQDVENVMNTRELDNVMHLVVALREVGDFDMASDQVMGIANYSLDTSVDKCVNEKDCAILIMTSAKIVASGDVEITMTFVGANDKSTLEKGVMIGNITFYGLRTKKTSNGLDVLRDSITIVCNSEDDPFELIMPAAAILIWDGKSCKPKYAGLRKIEDSFEIDRVRESHERYRHGHRDSHLYISE